MGEETNLENMNVSEENEAVVKITSPPPPDLEPRDKEKSEDKLETATASDSSGDGEVDTSLAPQQETSISQEDDKEKIEEPIQTPAVAVPELISRSPISAEERAARDSTPEKKVIMLNPVAISNMLKSKSSESGREDATASPGTSAGGNESPVKRNEFLKLSQALATALKKKVFCANTNCNLKTDTVYDAPAHACLYFGMRKATSPKICLNCFKKAEVFHMKSKAIVTRKENLFDLTFEIQTASSEAVVDLDSPVGSPTSSSEKMDTGSQGDQSSTGDIYSISFDKFQSILNQTLNKFAMELQLEKCASKVNDEVDELASQLSALDTQLEQLRDKIEGTTRSYNENIAANSTNWEIGAVNIDAGGAITITKNPGLDKIEGLSRLGARSLNRAIADLKSIEKAEIPEVQLGPRPGPGSSPCNRRMSKLIFAKPKEGQDVYAMHRHSLCFWLPAKIMKVTQQKLSANYPTIYTVLFQQRVKPRSKSSDDQDSFTKDVLGKQVSFKKPSSVTLPVGTRIIARFNDLLNTDAEVDGMLYAGIVAEIPRDINKFRYLVFFDDGYAQYVQPNEVLPVVESSPDVWLDVHKNSQDFIREYVTKFPERHMVRAEIGATFSVELNGSWIPAKIIETDGSLMKVQYLRPTEPGIQMEWIYRGSTRLGPLFTRLKSLQAKPTLTVARRHTYSSRRTNFSFEVNRNSEDDPRDPKVARKHTGFEAPPGADKYGVIKAKNGLTISTKLESEGSMIKIQIPRDCPSPRQFAPHTCSRECAYPFDETTHRRISPLAIPFYLGWARELSVNRDKVFYHTPCGVRCGSYSEIHSYIVRTCCEIPIDFFSVEPNIDCLNAFEPLRKIAFLKDISYGKEWTPVTCVNSLDHELPLYMDYKTARVPGKDVEINDDDGFLICCDCEDDCQDKEKCACWQMTMSGVSFKLAAEEDEQLVGYENRRLKNHVLSGIYECNRNCKCRSTCFNRVVQQKVKWPIQLFKTVAKGWGVRALHDMPRGSFICVYTGQLLTDAGANEAGIEAGDEYLAELDFIECNEQMKEDYEADATDIENEEPGTKSKARLEKANLEKMNEEQNKPDLHVAKKSTSSVIQKAVKSTGGIKRKHDDDTASVSSGYSTETPAVNTRPVARKSGSKNGSSLTKQNDTIPGIPTDGKSKVAKTPSVSSGVPSPSSTLSKRSSKDEFDSDDDDGNELQGYSSFSASLSAKNPKNAPRIPLREYFGKDESVYIMDAKSMGNFGRYLNHSCDPNVFVQNLFVDTHDPRFPWVAFFTKKDVKAGTELTWDYNYEIGSVPTKTLYCYCLQSACRGRLL